MGTKRIVVKSSERTKYFKWWESDREVREDRDGMIGKAAKLEDAIALAKAHTGGANQKVDISDV
jgi:hypothetical protein